MRVQHAADFNLPSLRARKTREHAYFLVCEGCKVSAHVVLEVLPAGAVSLRCLACGDTRVRMVDAEPGTRRPD